MNFKTFVYLTILCISCQNGEPEEVKEFSVVDSLTTIYHNTDFNEHIYENKEALKVYRNKAIHNLETTPQQIANLAVVELKAGEIDSSILHLNQLIQENDWLKEVNNSNRMLYEVLAIAYLRKGEIDNCLANHNKESCIFPISGKGIHTQQNGSKEAIRIYKKLLSQDPDDSQSQWLLNLAYMTIDEYPDGVPKEYLISPESFSNELTGIKPFENLAMELGVAVNDLSGASIMEDFDNDGDLDLIVSSWNLKGKTRYFESRDGRFIETSNNGLEGQYGGLNMVPTDYNNDGNMDIFIIRGAWRMNKKLGIYPNSLLKGNGNGTFEDITLLANLYEIAPSQSVVWRDFNNDGWLDLFVANETVPIKNSERYPCQMYLNNKNGTFTNITQRIGMNLVAFFKGAAAADIDNDGDQDIFLSNLAGQNLLLINTFSQSGELKFEISANNNSIKDPAQSFPCWFFDYDNDGWEDLFVSAYSDFTDSKQTEAVANYYMGTNKNIIGPKLYKNDTKGNFNDITDKMQLNIPLHSMGCNYGDFNNDGYLDFYLGTGAPDYRSIVPNRLFINNHGENFIDATFEVKVGNIQKGHGISIADFDNDGDQDIYAVMGGAYSGDFYHNALFQNPNTDNKFVNIKLVGKTTNHLGIGSRLKLEYINNDKKNTIYRTISSGSSFGSNSIIAEIGLPISTIKITDIAVLWANGSTTYKSYGALPLNKLITITEDKNQPKIESITSIKTKKSLTPHCNHKN